MDNFDNQRSVLTLIHELEREESVIQLNSNGDYGDLSRSFSLYGLPSQFSCCVINIQQQHYISMCYYELIRQSAVMLTLKRLINTKIQYNWTVTGLVNTRDFYKFIRD